MTREEFGKLNVGDIVGHPLHDHNYVVTGNYGGRVTAVRTVDMTNPSEWLLLTKVASWDAQEGRLPPPPGGKL